MTPRTPILFAFLCGALTVAALVWGRDKWIGKWGEQESTNAFLSQMILKHEVRLLAVEAWTRQQGTASRGEWR